MITDTQRRNQILRRISRIPNDKLKELDEYVTNLETKIPAKQKTLTYAGTWHDIENSVFEDLTKNLVKKRQTNRHRIDG